MQTTTIAEIVVVCDETFHVKDLTTNEIIQGSERAQTVSHLVRIEMDVALDVVNDDENWMQSNWRIADVDDLVGQKHWWTPYEL